MQTINRFKSRPRIATSCRELLKKQRADRLSGAWRRQRGNPLYLAVHDLGTPRPINLMSTFAGMIESIRSPALRITAAALRFHGAQTVRQLVAPAQIRRQRNG